MLNSNRRAAASDEMALGELVMSARRGDRKAYETLVLRFSEPMTASIRATLSTSRHWNRSVGPSDVADLLHEVLIVLLERGPKLLERWDPLLGLPLEGLFKVTARRVARSYLRSGRRSGWAETPSSDRVIARALCVTRAEDALLARDGLRRVLARCPRKRCRSILGALYLQGLTLDEVCRTWSISKNAVYCVTRRFRASARALRAED